MHWYLIRLSRSGWLVVSYFAMLRSASVNEPSVTESISTSHLPSNLEHWEGLHVLVFDRFLIVLWSVPRLSCGTAIMSKRYLLVSWVRNNAISMLYCDLCSSYVIEIYHSCILFLFQQLYGVCSRSYISTSGRVLARSGFEPQLHLLCIGDRLWDGL